MFSGWGDPLGSLSHSNRSATTSVSATFQRQRERFKKDLATLEANTTSALDAKKLKASLLRSRLKDMAIQDIIHNHESNPDFLDLGLMLRIYSCGWK